MNNKDRYFVNTGKQAYADWSGDATSKRDALRQAREWLKVKRLPRGTQVWKS